MYDNEIWKDVVGYEGLYQVSDWGRVKSLPRTKCKGKILKQSVASTGYWVVGFPKHGKTIKREVHALVAEAFIGLRPAQYHTHHKNENKLDNTVQNLEYRPRGEHSSFHSRGERNKTGKLTAGKVFEIRRMLAEGFTQVQIASKFGVAQIQISCIKLGKTWRHI